MCRHVFRVLCFAFPLSAVAFAGGTAFVGIASAAPAALHQPPVVATIIDHFRPPPAPWLPGNRGIEYDTDIGAPITASAPGTVVFAGRIGSSLYLTVQHDPALSTTYSYVAAIEVRRGQRVLSGQRIATAGDTFHFGARFHGRYIDPELLFVAVPRKRVRLIE